jgi:hypothetical protein
MSASLASDGRRCAWERARRLPRSSHMSHYRWSIIGALATSVALAGCAAGSSAPVAAGVPAHRAGADSAVPINGPNCVARFASTLNLVELHTQHPESVHAPGTLPLNSPELQLVLADWPDPRSFVAQATPRELATYGFVGEPASITGPGPATGPTSPDDPEDIVVFHGNWSAGQVNMHGVGDGAHVRWVFVDARTGVPFGGGYGDCTNE